MPSQSLSQESNVVMAVGSNDEVYPISRHDLEVDTFGAKIDSKSEFIWNPLILFGIHMEFRKTTM